ncbi:hypothetical protein AQUCO_07600092v1, partial [Aquilegia coerulea]
MLLLPRLLKKAKALAKLTKANLEEQAESDNYQSYINRFDLLGDYDSELSQYTKLHEEILKENTAASLLRLLKNKPKLDWLELPVDVMSLIFTKLGPLHILHNAQSVCSSWRNLSKDPYFFRSIDLRNSPTEYYYYDAEKMIKKTVDRSCGQLAFGSEVLIELVRKLPLLEELELWYEVFSAELVKEVGRSCSQIKSLELKGVKAYSWGSSDEEAYAIADYIPQLRHLHFSYCKLTSIGVEVMLNGCPNLEYLDIEHC